MAGKDATGSSSSLYEMHIQFKMTVWMKLTQNRYSICLTLVVEAFCELTRIKLIDIFQCGIFAKFDFNYIMIVFTVK